MEGAKKPDFIIIGAQKCGTSTMFHHLAEHPDVFLPKRKELHFFDENYALGMEYYLRFFNRRRMPDSPFCTGEASPFYFFHPKAASRIKSNLPEIKLILLLRNPVNRAYSQYHHMKRKGRLSLSFEHAIHLEPEILKNRKDAFVLDDQHSDLIYRRFSFLARSRYVEQLPVWYQYFNRDQLLILRSEDYFHDPASVFQQTYRFLGLPDFRHDFPKAHKPSDYPPMKPETRQKLIEYFKPFNHRFYELAGRDFGWD